MTVAAAPPRIGIDGRVFEGPRTGVGRYIFELCRELDCAVPSYAEFFVYARRPVDLPPVSARWHLRVESSRVAAKLPASVWLKARASALIRRDALSAFWGTASLLPPLAAEVRTVVTVYDLNHLVAPETMPTTTRLVHRAFFARDVRRADVVVAISFGSAERLRARLGIATAAVITPAVTPSFADAARDEAHVTYNGLGVRRPYFLAVGTREPRKNLPVLVRAFAAGRRAGLPPDATLVLTGARGWRERPLEAAIAELPPGSVLQLGYVSDPELAALYADATAFVFPSRYEGYGIPIVEARACGAVIIASDVAELREAGGSDATYVTPSEGCLTQALLAAARGELPRAATPPSPDGWQCGARTMAALLIGDMSHVTPREPAGEAAPSPARSA